MLSKEELEKLHDLLNTRSINSDEVLLLILLGFIFDLFPKENPYDIPGY